MYFSACIPSATFCRFFELINSESLSSEAREVLISPYNSHYIVAVISPILFIVMIVMSILMMVIQKQWAPYITAILSVPVSASVQQSNTHYYSSVTLHMHLQITLEIGHWSRHSSDISLDQLRVHICILERAKGTVLDTKTTISCH